MAKLGAAVAIVLTLLAALVGLSPCARASGISDAIRFVPQLELTDLNLVKVAFAPDDIALLLIVNDNGRVDIFDISNPGTPVKITEILANATSAAFAPTRTKREKIRIATGGGEGTVRLWTLDGKPAAEPFKEHSGPVHSVAFSADGTRIVSGGKDGTVRLWNITSRSSTMLLDSCGLAIGFGFVDAKFFWIRCSDRIRLESTAFEPRGELFFSDEGLAALVYDEGVYIPSDRLKQPFRKVVPVGQVIWQHGSLPELSAQRVKQVLLDDWTWRGHRQVGRSLAWRR